MTRPLIRIHNSETDEVIDREMTVAEFKVYEAEKAAKDQELADIAAKAELKASLLQRLGLTEEEAALLLK
mgnify:CR=1 FL=1|jgi:hypothetical protein